MSIKSEIIKKALGKFPKSPDLTLAKKIYADNKENFKGVENIRKMVAYYRGKRANDMGKASKDTTYHQPLSYNYNPFNLPESHANPFEPYIINQSRTLIISDLHFPYQDNRSIELALNYGIQKKVNCILINGDLIDFATISRHEKDWRMRTVGQEFEAVRQFLKTIRHHFKNTKIVYKFGNHDERWEKWLFVKAPELFDDTEFKLEVRLRLGELKIVVVKDKRPIKIGKLTVLHGHELPGTSGGVNPARGTFLKTMESVLVGHYHKTSEHTEASMGGNIISVKSVGSLCGLNPMFMPINKWNHGFAYCELGKDGDYMLENLKIVKGKIYK